MSKGTPGPWDWTGGYPQTVVGNDDGLVVVAQTFYEPDAPPHPNLLLILAAPDLLEALEALSAGMSSADDTRPLVLGAEVARARAAIAKAKGEA